MLWILAVVVLLVVIYCFLVISGENVYRVTYHDAEGKQWTILISASTHREAASMIKKIDPEVAQITEVVEEL